MSDYDCIVTLSGGIDSTVLVHKLIKEEKKPFCAYIDYGAKSKNPELKAARNTCSLLGLKLHVIPLPLYLTSTKAYILGNTDEFKEDSMFWLEGRNAVICTLLAVLAASMSIKEIYIGINASDNDEENNYPDTDGKFVAAMNLLLLLGFKSKCKVIAPWIDLDMNKSDVIKLGVEYGINWVRDTHSCSNTLGKPCCDYYICESCQSRRYDFEEIGLKDPFYK